MKPITNLSKILLPLSALVLGVLTACGGGGGGGGIGVAEGGIRGTGSSVGPVSGFGSVIVNGVRFETDQILNGEVKSNDGIACERGCGNPLQKGMILRVEGQWRTDGTGEADSLEYDDTFRGVATNVRITEQSVSGNPAAGTFEILGQTITFDRRTVFRLASTFDDSADLEGFQVRVSAWKNGVDYRSSFVGTVDTLPGGLVELEGSVSGFNSGNRNFMIGTQEVQYENNDVFRDGLSTGDLESGNIGVEVEGVRESDDTVSARTIRRADSRRFAGQENEDIDISGPVENYNINRSDFLINDVKVIVTAETEFDDLARTRISDGLLVNAEGRFQNGNVIAEKIELLEGDAEVEAKVTGEGSLASSWIVGGVTVVISDKTLIDTEDGFSDAIGTGAFIEASGIERVTGNGLIFIDALNIEFEDDVSSDFELQGRLAPDGYSLTDNRLSILGLSMMVAPDAIDSDGDIADCQYLEVEYSNPSADQYVADDIECDD